MPPTPPYHRLESLRPGHARARDAAKNRREFAERRHRNPLLSDWRWAFRGRRRRVRRDTDRTSVTGMVDLYHPGLLLVALATFVLSVLDAGFTLTLIERGVTTEANPVMNLLLARNVSLFVGVKTLMTGAGILALVIFSNMLAFRRLRLDRALYVVFAAYCALVCYEITLLWLSSGH